jgi:hypothetical protein
MRHAERQSFGLSLASSSRLGEIAVLPVLASAVNAPRGSCFSSRSTRGRLTMGCEGRALQSLSRTRFSPKGRVQDVMRSRPSLVPAGHRSRRQTLGDLLCVYMAADATISSRLQWNSLSPTCGA